LNWVGKFGNWSRRWTTTSTPWWLGAYDVAAGSSATFHTQIAMVKDAT